jgi:hypothetical protein
MSSIRRRELIEKIQEERKSLVVAYALSDRRGCEGSISPDAVEELYRLLCDFKPFERKPLDLFLFAHQGDWTVPWHMVGMIREMFDLFNVIVPHKAHGPATMIALGADTIIMGERGTLSPIEITVPGDPFLKRPFAEGRGMSVEDAKALISFVEGFGRMREKQKIEALLRILDKVDPLFLGSMHKQEEQVRLDCLGLLGEEKKRFQQGEKQENCKPFNFGHRFISALHFKVGSRKSRRPETSSNREDP